MYAKILTSLMEFLRKRREGLIHNLYLAMQISVEKFHYTERSLR